jgi:hypothetical protein
MYERENKKCGCTVNWSVIYSLSFSGDVITLLVEILRFPFILSSLIMMTLGSEPQPLYDGRQCLPLFGLS